MEIRDIVFVYQLKTPELVRWHSRRHSHAAGEYELHYFLHGDAWFKKGTTRYRISPGMLHFSPPRERHAVQPGDLHRPVSFYAVLFSPAENGPLKPFLDDPRCLNSFPRRVGTRYRVLFEDLKNRYAHTRSARRYAAVHMLQSLLWDLIAESDIPISPDESADNTEGTAGHEILDHRPSVPSGYSGVSSDFNVHVNRAVHLFETHVYSRLTVREVARRIGLSQAHLTRLFTEHVGVSPLQYYRRLRMDVAASLLLNTTRSIKEISWELGYSNPFHFSRSFSRYARLSPQAYRDQYFKSNPTGYEGRIV